MLNGQTDQNNRMTIMKKPYTCSEKPNNEETPTFVKTLDYMKKLNNWINNNFGTVFEVI